MTSAGQALKTPVPGGGKPNPACAGVAPKDASPTDDNGQSVGSVITFGQFRAIDLGDLLWNKENELVCPNNPVGTVDAFFVTHHGLDASNSPALVLGVQPRVAIMQNGTRKGANVEAMKTMRSSPGLEDIWQLHWSYNAGIELNSPGVFIANIDDPATIAGVLNARREAAGQVDHLLAGRQRLRRSHAGVWIKMSVQPDGTFTVTNSRNGFSKTS